jgi:transcriptional regulator with PAS, ATPase and Fis domain
LSTDPLVRPLPRAAAADPGVSEELLKPFDLGETPPDENTPLAGPTLAIRWRSPSYLSALSRLRKFARTSHPLLICGETGGGKTSFAEVAHAEGPHSSEPFVVVSCPSLPEALLEAELFGHVRGAFTGAEAAKAGLIRAARSGTVFLDEIDKASRSLQAALLQVLDRREVRSVGGHAPDRVSARFVFATNRHLPAAAARGEFLPDLLYRIAGMSVLVPPVRERSEDLDLLVALALRTIRRDDGLAGVTVTPDARNLLASYEWPGNVRELFGVLRAAAHLLDGQLRIGVREIELAAAASKLEAHVRRVQSAEVLTGRMREFEKQEILLALRLEGGNQTKAASRLGLSRRGLNKKLHRYELLDQLEREGLRVFRSRRTAPARGVW